MLSADRMLEAHTSPSQWSSLWTYLYMTSPMIPNSYCQAILGVWIRRAHHRSVHLLVRKIGIDGSCVGSCKGRLKEAQRLEE